MKTARILAILVLALGLACGSYAAYDTWTTKANMPTARYVVSSSVVDGKIYAIGGDAGSRASVVEAYDPLTDTWTRKANMPMRRGGGTTSVVNGRIYYMGGRPSYNGANIPSVIEYDATTDTWATKANMMRTPRTWLSSSVVDGKCPLRELVSPQTRSMEESMLLGEPLDTVNGTRGSLR
jgi:N-acetylneuraminic acid mutarotase